MRSFTSSVVFLVSPFLLLTSDLAAAPADANQINFQRRLHHGADPRGFPSGFASRGDRSPDALPRLEPSSNAVLAIPTEALAISDHGHVAGYIWNLTVPSHKSPFLWERGVLTDLDPQGDWLWGYYGPLGVDVNAHGQVVASASFPGEPNRLHPLLFDRGEVVDLMETMPGLGAATAINNRGQVAGVFENITSGTSNAFLWDDGRWTDLGPSEAFTDWSQETFAYGMFLNDRGDVVAIDPPHPEVTTSFLWRNGQRTPLDFVVTGINKRGQVIGNSYYYYGGVVSSSRAYLWEDGVRTDLGTLGGEVAFASAINDKGQVAGMSTDATGEDHAFLWEDGEMVDLSGPANHLVVEGISARGQVVGFSGFSEAWLWDHGSIVPIPSADGSCCGFPGPRVMINDGGLIAFNSLNGSYFESFLWSDGDITPLGPEVVASKSASVTKRGAGNTVDAADPTTTNGPARTVRFELASGNPFSGSASLRYALPRAENVTIDVFDVRGARVRSLVDTWQPAGDRLIAWDGNDAAGRRVPSGIYFARLRVGAESRVVKLVIRR